MLTILIATALAASPPPLDATPQTRIDTELRCHLGVYALPAGRTVAITGDGGQPRGLQYTLSNGQFGVLHEGVDGAFSDGELSITFAPCSARTLKLTRGIVAQQGTRLRLIEKETSFNSDSIKLHGKLVLPSNGRAETVAIWIEGSNNDPSTDDTVWQYELARRGVAIFVYDKRGTGASAGAPTSDFHARARDTAAALKEVLRLAPRARRLGVIGGSQGGWVAPLTATLARVDFVIAAFAMAEGPIAQDRELVERQLLLAGFDDAELAEARKLTAITERIVRSNMKEGLDDLDAFKSSHADAPWLKAVQPRSYTGLFLQFPSDVIKANGPAMAQGLSFDFEPRPIIETIRARKLWLLGGSDQQAPNATTQAILRQIQSRRSDLAVVVFPNADHGLIEPIETSDGTATGYSSKLFDIAADWIKNQRLPAKGKFIEMPATD